MAKVRVDNFTLSLDGYAAGPNQSVDAPLGVGGERLHAWAFETRSFREHLGLDGGLSGGTDDEMVARGNLSLGATIMGRNMFGPVRGAWDGDWRGWWGDTPPFRHPVFVLTHHARPSLAMEGGTTFHFVTDGIHAALDRAREAAGDDDVRIGGGAATIRQFLAEQLVDELHVVVAPILLGSGERFFVDDVTVGYACAGATASASVTHYRLERKS